jgi:hypothetical protein
MKYAIVFQVSLLVTGLNVLGLDSGDVQFESQPEYRLS